jgi:hypothetical protein
MPHARWGVGAQKLDTVRRNQTPWRAILEGDRIRRSGLQPSGKRVWVSARLFAGLSAHATTASHSSALLSIAANVVITMHNI